MARERGGLKSEEGNEDGRGKCKRYLRADEREREREREREGGGGGRERGREMDNGT